jgi:hypothetical protein
VATAPEHIQQARVDRGRVKGIGLSWGEYGRRLDKGFCRAFCFLVCDCTIKHTSTILEPHTMLGDKKAGLCGERVLRSCKMYLGINKLNLVIYILILEIHKYETMVQKKQGL